jgi:sigma-B regulation protein RsbU (phosphoserine phosphatase)
VCVISIAANGISNVATLSGIQTVMEEGSRDLGYAAAVSSSESLVSLALADLRVLTDEKAANIDSMFRKYADSLELMKDYVEELYNSPSEFIPIKVKNYLDVPEDELALHWFLEPDADMRGTGDEAALSAAGLRDETYLLGNAERIFRIMTERYPEMTTVCIATESGQNLQFDRDAARKVGVIGPELVIHERPWYVAPKLGEELYISDTYRDIAGRGLTVTMSAPIKPGGVFRGVVCFDIRIDDLDKQIREAIVGNTGWAELLGDDRIISSPDLTPENERELPSYWAQLQDAESGSLDAAVNGLNVFVVWATLPLTGWRLAYTVPESDVTAPAEAKREQILGIAEEAAGETYRSIFNSILITAALLLLVIILAGAAAVYVSRRLSEPIVQLTAEAEKIGEGDLERILSVSTGDEIEALANTINEMVRSIKQIMGDRERLGAELGIAAKIQASMLPTGFPPFPERDEIDLYASMLPAKEVGGDFYDFFMVDDDTLATVIADVSGKGVPAALFMVTAKTLIKNNAQMGKDPKEVFEAVNNILCENNDAGMFVTAFMAYLNMKTGELSCVNAGHNPPLLTRDGEFTWLKLKAGFVLAGMEDMRYTQSSVMMRPDDVLYLYTDGVTEAVDTANALWGNDGLISAANLHLQESLRDFTVSIKEEIDAFADGAMQADDITMLALRYKKGRRNG